MSSRVRKQSEGQKLFPMKALIQFEPTTSTSFSNNLISPERSPVRSYKGKNSKTEIRRTTSLDALYMRPWNFNPSNTILQLDKATQTDESYLDRSKGIDFSRSETPPDMKIEKVIRQRLQRTQRGEHSVSSQTLSPVHVKASPVLIPPRTCPPAHMRPMRSSVEGLNQEIEKLVLIPGQQHTCRPETSMFSRGKTPEEGGHDTRSVNTQTPIIGDMVSSDESQSTSPEECASASNASPRINRFLAREPPDGCEKVNLKPTDTDQTATTHFKPCVGFKLRPSLGSAFKLLQPIPILHTPSEDDDKNDNENE